MKRIANILIAVALVTLMTACGGKKNQEVDPGEEGWVEYVPQELRDSTIFGICTDGSAMNTLQMVTDNGDTLTLNVGSAKDAGMVFGGYATGDRMAVLADKNNSRATMIVNETTLMGEWVMPNPMDGSSEMGINIKEGGIAESINQGSLIYKTWRLNNGQLEIVSVREGGGDFEETELFQLLYLTNDSLAFKEIKPNRGVKEPDVIFEYRHPQPEDEGDDLGIELEEGSFEDFVM